MSPPNVSPWRTLGFILLISGLIAAGIDSKLDGTSIAGYELKFPIWQDFLESERKVNMDALLENYHEVESGSSSTKSAESKKNPFTSEKIVLPPRHLQFPTNVNPLEKWFSKIDREARHKTVRVLHYGDSQIEGDRISAQIRQSLQVRFGGVGPGMISITPQVPAFSMEVTPGNGLSRHVGFTPVEDSTVTHGNFGPRFTISRCDTSRGSCMVRISPRRFGYARARNFETMRIFWQLHDENNAPTLRISANDSIPVVASTQNARGMETELPKETEFIDLDVSSLDGDVLAVSLEGNRGVIVDNIALRGSSGLIFTRADSGAIENYVQPQEVGLILLQFGGNVVPYLKDTAQIQRYARSLGRQIANIQTRFPEASIIFIGPSDMATKVRTKMVTYPLLNPLRLELKSMALRAGCAYWDTYEAMGGQNAMSAWVEHDPPYASSDYVHFTPKGAKLVGEWISEALLDAYEEWHAYNKAME
jgi:hypothetical protein